MCSWWLFGTVFLPFQQYNAYKYKDPSTAWSSAHTWDNEEPLHSQ